jgi:hypothetical protein
MRILRYLTIAIGACIIGLLYISHIKSTKNIPIRFICLEHDFGDCTPGDDLKCHFEYTNDSVNAGKILSVQSSCGCLVETGSHTEIKPHASGQIGVMLKTESYDAPRDLEKSLLVIFDIAGKKESAALKVRAHLKLPFLVQPSELVFSSISQNDISSKRVTISRQILDKTSFGQIKIVPPGAYCEINESKRDQDRIIVDVKLHPLKTPLYPMPLDISFQNSTGSHHCFKIPICLLDSTASVVSIPEQYCCIIHRDWSPSEIVAHTNQLFQLKGRAGNTYQITNIECDDDGLLQWRKSSKNKNEFEIFVNVKPKRTYSCRQLLVHFVPSDNGIECVKLNAIIILEDSK